MCILLKSLYIEYSIYKSLKKHKLYLDFYQNKFLIKYGSISQIAFIDFLTAIETCVDLAFGSNYFAIQAY